MEGFSQPSSRPRYFRGVEAFIAFPLPSERACMSRSRLTPLCCSRQPKGFGSPRLPRHDRKGRGNDASGRARSGDEVAPSAQDVAGGPRQVGFVGAEEMGVAFTCGVCDTRVTKSIKRKSYEEGVCLVQCPGCDKYHVIADNLGMYSSITGGKQNVEQMAKEKGENFTRVESSVFDLEKLVSETADKKQGDGEDGSGKDEK